VSDGKETQNYTLISTVTAWRIEKQTLQEHQRAICFGIYKRHQTEKQKMRRRTIL